ncbi:MAG: hypothetical protein M3515_01075 [Actinomycetota bacterium]|nr:hypothetical protein [Actinomycetota bacterium]
MRITEDRGLLGPNGERIYRVHLLSEEDGEPDEFEVPGTALEPAAA